MSYDQLSGVRVVDLGIITAGASTTAILADLGADVVKVEGPSYIDPFRVWAGKGKSAEWWNESPFFAFTNRNKRGICIDLKQPAGRDVFLKLVEESDVLVENFRVGALEKLGLGPAELAKINPRLIYASISSQGLTGPDSGSVSFGSTLEGSSGLASLIAHEDGEPTVSGHALNYPDQVVSLFASAAILSALVERQSTGKGARIDVSQREVATFMLGERLSSKGGAAEGGVRVGAPAALNELVSCTDGRWVAVTIEDEGSLDAANRALKASRAGPEGFREAARTVTSSDLVGMVGGFGAARVALEARELADFVARRGQTAAVATGPDGGPAKGLPWMFGETPAPVLRSAPWLGRDNREIVVDVLGVKETAYQRLQEEGVVGQRPK